MIGLQSIATALIVVASVAALVRVLRFATRWRWLLALGQIAAGGLLWLALFPAQPPQSGGQLKVLTPGATSEQIAAASPSNSIALPGISAAVDSRIERSPDLASALRRHPQTSELHVIGHGLPSRDRDAARGLAVSFEPAALPDGIVEIAPPSSVQIGNRWRVAGRVQAAAAQTLSVELRDPADAISDSAKPDVQGRFVLESVARVAGSSSHTLRLVDASGQVRERIALEIDARADQPIRVLLLAAVPSPELKYLRRWASDAGLVVDSRIGLTDGVALTGSSAVAINAGLLAQQDLLIIDERRWSQLEVGVISDIIAAVEGGMGMLLRVSGPLTPDILAAWSQLGISLQAIDNPAAVALADDRRDEAPLLLRAPYQLPATWAALASTRSGDAVTAWTTRGRGRIGITTLADSHRYVLAGSPDRHGSAWARVTSSLARARSEQQPLLPIQARVGERATLCNLVGDGWTVEQQGSPVSNLLIDQTSAGCAAIWPTSAGRYRLRHGEQTWSFDVLQSDPHSALQAAQTQAATRALAGLAAPENTLISAPTVPRTAWLLAWLLVMTALWWAERQLGKNRSA